MATCRKREGSGPKSTTPGIHCFLHIILHILNCTCSALGSSVGQSPMQAGPPQGFLQVGFELAFIPYCVCDMWAQSGSLIRLLCSSRRMVGWTSVQHIFCHFGLSGSAGLVTCNSGSIPSLCRAASCWVLFSLSPQSPAEAG